MLDFFTIFSKGGILLFCFKGFDLDKKAWESFVHTVNSLNKTVFLQDKSDRKNVFEQGSLALKYKLDNEFELVFVVGYQKSLPLNYLDKLLDEIQLRFRDKYAQDLKEFNFQSNFNDFSGEFETTRALVEKKCKEIQDSKQMGTFKESAKSSKTVASMIIDKNSNATTTSTKKSTAQEIKTDDKAADGDDALDEETIRINRERMAAGKKKVPGPYKPKTPKAVKSPKPEKASKSGKPGTKWDPFMFNGKGPSEREAKELDRTVKSGTEDDAQLDPQLNQFVPDISRVNQSAVLEAMDEEESDDETLISDIGENKGKSGIWSTLTSLVGTKQLTDADVEPVISKMRDHLIGKNVASEVADKLCQSVASKLEGKVLGTFSTVHRTVKETLVESLVQLLTPKRRIDIIRDVLEAKANKRPYVIAFCGVNGVGKSTNLAKICFWLVENKCSVLIAACDTFRAGAVEQLRTHVKRLNSLYPSQNPNEKKDVVELYEKGYGKDAAGIAMEAINHARASHRDVVLIDTAGRMQDNEPLMRSLSKLIGVNDPDLVLFVGEALVGNEAVDQLVKFNRALADHSDQETPHTIDGIVLTKFDTIDDKVGSAISMTYITGQPIVFVGTGQTYTDLKTINSKAVVQLLMK